MKNKIIELATAQLGNNYTTYCKDMGYNYRIEWCACFISWLAKKLNITNIIPIDMSCNSQIAKFKNLGVWHTDRNIQAGDIIYYDWDRLGDSRPADHVGIVISNTNGNLIVVEGNKGNYPNDRVGKREINCNSPLIYGFARPKYPTITFYNAPIDMTFPTIRKGDIGNAVKALQLALVAYEYNIGKYGADGEFGLDTENAVKRFQKNSGIEVDGIVGKDTWSKLMN